MKTIKAFAFAGLMSASAVFAAANLWKFSGMLANEPYLGQVMTPGAIHCWDTAEPPSENNDYQSPCYAKTGGWWFGYGDAGGKVYDGAATTYDLTANEALKINQYVDGEGQVFIKNKGLGAATEGLHILFKLTAGTNEEPSVAGIGFNWRNKDGNDYENKGLENLKTNGNPGTGLCLEYQASLAGITVELGWNEASNGYNTWVYALPACATGFCKADIPWASFEQSYEGTTESLEYALANAEALKIAYKNKEPAPVEIVFKLAGLGWFGTCSGSAPDQTPIVTPKGRIAAQFSISGRALSISVPTHVQVINMQGAVVAQKTLGANETLNLANLPTGVYMVRSAKLGISQKVILK